ncbi:hypothetical protein F5Y10DRAFT_246555 [Nemania abortiva]|nr:hypothetical protein F5Y10DRAFT_246555 [Nemania abortiva]
MFNFWLFSRGNAGARDPSNDSYEHDTDWDVDENNPPEKYRVELSDSSTTVYGHPSTGGVLVLRPCNAVDLDFLGLSRLEPAQRSEDAAEEDRHCALMTRLGARWFKSVYDYTMMPYFAPMRHRRIKVVVAAWPRDRPGVWVVAMRNREEAGREGLGRVWNAMSMEERCEVVEKLGGTYYADPMLCPNLHLLEDEDLANYRYHLTPDRQRQSTIPTLPDIPLDG